MSLAILPVRVRCREYTCCPCQSVTHRAIIRASLGIACTQRCQRPRRHGRIQGQRGITSSSAETRGRNVHARGGNSTTGQTYQSRLGFAKGYGSSYAGLHFFPICSNQLGREEAHDDDHANHRKKTELLGTHTSASNRFSRRFSSHLPDRRGSLAQRHRNDPCLGPAPNGLLASIITRFERTPPFARVSKLDPNPPGQLSVETGQYATQELVFRFVFLQENDPGYDTLRLRQRLVALERSRAELAARAAEEKRSLELKLAARDKAAIVGKGVEAVVKQKEAEAVEKAQLAEQYRIERDELSAAMQHMAEENAKLKADMAEWRFYKSGMGK